MKYVVRPIFFLFVTKMIPPSIISEKVFGGHIDFCVIILIHMGSKNYFGVFIFLEVIAVRIFLELSRCNSDSKLSAAVRDEIEEMNCITTQ